MNRLASRWALLSALLCFSCRAEAETLVVKISGLGGKTGIVRVMLWKDAAGYPTRPEKAVAQKALAVSGPEAEMSFTGLPQGSYAAAAYVDENSNGIMDRSLLGWPIEPTAASNGARGLVGPPSFSAAAFDLKHPSQSIQLIFK
jgi:uncharacterized protein (DUF2141 family)